jgi:hypothetical protein
MSSCCGRGLRMGDIGKASAVINSCFAAFNHKPRAADRNFRWSQCLINSGGGAPHVPVRCAAGLLRRGSVRMATLAQRLYDAYDRAAHHGQLTSHFVGATKLRGLL